MMPRQKRVLAVASGGGHWQQLMLLAPALSASDVSYATTDSGMAVRAGITDAKALRDCSQRTPFLALICALQLFWLCCRRRPDVVVSTGALPGALALIIGKMVGAQTIWIDSIANAETMSTSAFAVRRFSDTWLSQWEDVAAKAGATWQGSVL